MKKHTYIVLNTNTNKVDNIVHIEGDIMMPGFRPADEARSHFGSLGLHQRMFVMLGNEPEFPNV